MQQEIRQIRRIGVDPVDEDIEIYLMVVRSVTVALRNSVARRFKERTGEYLVVFTKDYEELDFVLFERGQRQSQQSGRGPLQTIRPRSLTVNRRNPSAVARRVLQRFTFTEADALFSA